MKRMTPTWALIALLMTGCASGAATPSRTATGTIPAETSTAVPASATPPPTPTIQPSRTPQARLALQPGGPDLENFPPGTNPLTGLPVQDPALLNLPAVLVSISNMPPTARPQAGTSFAPWIYEMFIGEGTTRFMSVFYGDLPRRIPNDQGGCEVNTTGFKPSGAWVGNRVWLDENKNGIQEPWEAGVGGVCVSLADPGSGKTIASTSSNSNGYYAFDASGLQPGANYAIKFSLPAAFGFTQPDIGNNDQDSDVDPASSVITFTFSGVTDSSLDAGLVLVKPGPAVFAASDIAPDRTYVGPIRSGRLTYNDFARMYPAGCLVYASAGNGIRQQLQGCDIIFGEKPEESPNTALLDVDHLLELAKKSKLPNQPVNYSGHLFDPAPPSGGVPGTSLWVYFHLYSQSYWQYDPVSGSYLRQTDDGDGKGRVHPDTDRLTGRQLAFENVVVILADYQVFRHGQYDIQLCCGQEGYAFLFRDGLMYPIRWSTNNRAWEQQTGLLRPLHFTGVDKQPFPLKPGRTWVSIMTINSGMRDYLNDGRWQAQFAMPDDLATPKP